MYRPDSRLCGKDNTKATMKIITHNEQETKDLAPQVLENLGDETVLLLQGDLGSGKTVFIKGLAESLGIQEVVTSPTFVIMKVYPVADHKTFKRLVHVDLYRLDNITQAQLRELGLQEYIDDPATLVAIEWPELAEQELQGATISFAVDSERRLIVTKEL